MKLEGNILFHEEQRMRQSRIWWIFVAMITVSFALIVLLAIRGEIPQEEVLVAFLILVPAFGLAFYLMYAAKLETEVREDGVYYRWAPFFRKPFFIPKESIERFQERKSPLMQYGFRFFPTYGRVHTVSGRQGIQFYLTTGRKIYIGTQELFRFRKALETINAKNKQ
jgi:hypothetical protein